MSNFSLAETGQTDILTSFRFEIHIVDYASSPIIGLDNHVVGYTQDCELPSAPGEPIPWHMPGGMKNYQAGKRTPRAINLSFVVDSNPDKPNVYKMLEKWTHATYNLNDGTNRGKANYCTDGIYIQVKGEDNNVKYTFHLLRAQVTSVSYGALASESNTLIKVGCTLQYDNFEVFKGASGPLLRDM